MITKQMNKFKKFKGKHVICRSRNAGLIFGEIVDMGFGFVHLKNARRIWKPISFDKLQSWYEGVANSGLCPEKGIISSSTKSKIIVEDYEITLCSKKAISSLKKFKANETSI